MDRIASAKDYFLKGHSCAQSILAAYRDVAGLSEHDALALASMLGAGIAGLRETCGVVTASLLVLGADQAFTAPEDKPSAYRAGREFIHDFTVKFASANCKTLLDLSGSDYYESPLPRDESYYKTRPCLRFVEGAAKLLEERLSKTE